MNEVREILANEMRFLDETLDQMEELDLRNSFHGWDMSRLMSYAYQLDASIRQDKANDRKREASIRLCRIIAAMYQRAIAANDCDECDRLADALLLATKSWGDL